MNADWTLSAKDVRRWSDFVQENKNKSLPKARLNKNIRRRNLDVSESEIWKVLVSCQVTTQQKSGEGSAVDNFIKNTKSSILDIEKCRKIGSLEEKIQQECSSAGLRFGPTIAKNLVRIFSLLENGEWPILKKQLDTLLKSTSLEKERAVISYLLAHKKYPGLGQKQSRNFIQWLGLSRYEVPIDSRVIKRLKAMNCNFVPSSSALADESVYLFVQDGLQKLAKKLDIYPCYLDACIFASFELPTAEKIIG